jgi:hypothetical protein
MGATPGNARWLGIDRRPSRCTWAGLAKDPVFKEASRPIEPADHGQHLHVVERTAPALFDADQVETIAAFSVGFGEFPPDDALDRKVEADDLGLPHFASLLASPSSVDACFSVLFLSATCGSFSDFY